MKRAAFLLLILMLAALPASAQEPERVRQLVYHVNAFDGQAWEAVFYPQSEDTIYLLAGHPNTITPRETLVYFWTITQRFLPDWAELDELVDARMEIRRGGAVIDTLTLSEYVLQGERAGPETPLQLYRGQDAHRRFRQYREDLDAYWAALDEYTQQRTEGGAGDAPEAPRLFSTKVLQGFIVELDEGSYEIHLLDQDNQPIPGSQKQLRVFAPRREGLTYELIPESSWTVREYADTPEDTIYVTNDSRLFVQPYHAQEYNAYLYGKLRDPQAPPGDELAWMWAPQELISTPTLRVSQGTDEQSVVHKDFLVEQSARSSLGYTISALDDAASRSPSFSGYELTLSLAPGESAQVWLVDESGNELPGSRRRLRGVQPLTGELLFLPSALPLLWGLFLMLRRIREPD